MSSVKGESRRRAHTECDCQGGLPEDATLKERHSVSEPGWALFACTASRIHCAKDGLGGCECVSPRWTRLG